MLSILANAVAGLIPVVWPFHPAQSVTRDYTLPIWQISITKDRFAEGVHCGVYQGSRDNPKISYGQNSLVFHFSPRVNTLQAIYRLDGGGAKRWQDIYPIVIEAGATLPGASMINPTGGLIIVPVSQLVGIHTVTIRPTPKSSPRTFTIDGYSDAIEAARARGCRPDTAFVR